MGYPARTESPREHSWSLGAEGGDAQWGRPWLPAAANHDLLRM